MTGLTVNREGHSINSIYGLEAIGYISEEDYNADGSYKHATQFGAFAPGDIKYKDQNNDGIINNEDEVIIGNTVPRFTYGLNLDASWKGFDFSMFWQGIGKADGYLNKQATMPFYWEPLPWKCIKIIGPRIIPMPVFPVWHSMKQIMNRIPVSGWPMLLI